MILKIKKFFKDNEGDIILVIGIIFIALICFYLGRVSVFSWGSQEEVGESTNFPLVQDVPIESMGAKVGEIQVESELNNKNEEDIVSSQKKDFSVGKETRDETEDEVETTETKENLENVGEQGSQLVASKNGEVYHYIWCPGAKRIKEENKIYFNSKEEAEKAGYRPAKNCPGL